MRLTASPHTKASIQHFGFQQIMGSPSQQLSSGDSIFQVDLFFGSTRVSLDIVLDSGTIGNEIDNTAFSTRLKVCSVVGGSVSREPAASSLAVSRVYPQSLHANVCVERMGDYLARSYYQRIGCDRRGCHLGIL